MKKNNLSQKKYRDEIYKKNSYANIQKPDNYLRDLLNLLKQYINYDTSKKMIEIGCAPGNNLYHLNKMFDYQINGVEYSEEGVKKTREFFEKSNVSGNIIFDDFFKESFLKKYKEKFDLVFSMGFIEHFKNSSNVVKLHAQLLKKNGYLLIIIPNLTGLNSGFSKFFKKDILEIHNLEIMKLETFKKIFDDNKLDVKYCDYFGNFNFGLFPVQGFIKKKIHMLLAYPLVNNPISFLISLFFKKKNYAKSLVCICQKREK